MKRLVTIGLVVALPIASATAVLAAAPRAPRVSRSVKVSRTVGHQAKSGRNQAGFTSRPGAAASVQNGSGSRAQVSGGSGTRTWGQAGSPQTGSRRVNEGSSEGSGVTVTRNGLNGGGASVKANNATSALKKVPKL